MQEQAEELEQLSPEETQRLIHELRVHQIELELQNEELQNAQLELQASRNRYADLYDFAPVGYLTLDAKGSIIGANLTCTPLFGIERASLLKLSMAHLIIKEDNDLFYLRRRQLLDTKTSQPCELRMQRKDGSHFYAHLECMPVLDQEDNVTHIRVAVTDISKLKNTEEQLRLALREIHHRTRNNMTVLDSLLSIQSEQLEDQQAVQMFREARERIQAMALVHTKLYRSDLSNVNLKEYIESLAYMLRSGYQVGSGKIALRLDTDPVYVPIDGAVPCGLLLNELITNALKYAFPGERDGEISISLHEAADKSIELRVRDNGVGLPEDFNFKTAHSTGAQIVSAIARQFRGTIAFNHQNPGTEVVIRFQKPVYRKRF